MSEKVDILRSLVNERLTAAAEEIFALVERTIVEYEEELCRSKEENQRKQQLLDSVLNPQLRLHATEVGPGKPCVKPEPQEVSIDPETHLPPAEILYFPGKGETAETASQQQKTFDDENEMTSEDWTRPWEPPADSEEEESHDWNQLQASDAKEQGNSFYKITKMSSQEGLSVMVNEELSMTLQKGELRKQNCPICGKTLKRDLWSHMLVHTGERPFRCSVCNKGFTRRSSLTLHKGLHLSEKPFQCSICEKGFTQKSHLKIHMNSHTKQELKCNTTVNRKNKRKIKKAAAVEATPDSNENIEEENLVRVQTSPPQMGSESKTRKCAGDSDKTQESRSLRPIAKLTLAERGVPKECQVCGKFFHDIWKHMLLHTEERPFRCKVCRKGFTRMSSLTLHKALHMNEKPFKCSICDRGFTQNSNLKVHMTKHAKEQELLQQKQNPETDKVLNVYVQEYFQNHQSIEPQQSTSAQ